MPSVTTRMRVVAETAALHAHGVADRAARPPRRARRPCAGRRRGRPAGAAPAAGCGRRRARARRAGPAAPASSCRRRAARPARRCCRFPAPASRRRQDVRDRKVGQASQSQSPIRTTGPPAAAASASSWVTSTTGRPAGARLGEDQLAHLLPQVRVELGKRFVEQQHARRRKQHARQRHARLLAAATACRDRAPPCRRDRRRRALLRPAPGARPCP